MKGFERRRERKKASIRQAALELFSSYGFEKVSISDIAHKARVSHVTIYNHFGSKEGLVQDTIKSAISGLTEKARVIINGDTPFLEKLELIVLGKAELASQYQGQLMQTVVRNNPEMQHFIQSLWLKEINKLLIELVREGKKLGYIDKDLSEDALLFYFEIVRRGSMSTADLLAEIKPDAKFVRDVNNLFLFGLVNKKENSRSANTVNSRGL